MTNLAAGRPPKMGDRANGKSARAENLPAVSFGAGGAVFWGITRRPSFPL